MDIDLSEFEKSYSESIARLEESEPVKKKPEISLPTIKELAPRIPEIGPRPPARIRVPKKEKKYTFMGVMRHLRNVPLPEGKSKEEYKTIKDKWWDDYIEMASEVGAGTVTEAAKLTLGHQLATQILSKIPLPATKWLARFIGGGTTGGTYAVIDESERWVKGEEKNIVNSLKRIGIKAAVIGGISVIGGAVFDKIALKMAKGKYGTTAARQLLGIEGNVDKASVDYRYNKITEALKKAPETKSNQMVGKYVKQEYSRFLKLVKGEVEIPGVKIKTVKKPSRIGKFVRGLFKRKPAAPPPPAEPIPVKVPKPEAVQRKVVSLQRKALKGITDTIAKKHVPGETKEIFSKLTENMGKRGAEEIEFAQKYNNEIKDLWVRLGMSGRALDVVAPTTKQTLGYFKKNKEAWSLFKRDAKRINEEIEFDKQSAGDIMRRGLEAQKRVEDASTRADVRDNLIDFMNDASVFMPEEAANFAKMKKFELRRRKDLWKIIGKTFGKISPHLEKVWQTGFTIDPEMERTYYPMLLSGNTRFPEFFKRTTDKLYANLSEAEDSTYLATVGLYYKHGHKYPKLKPLDAVLKAIQDEMIAKAENPMQAKRAQNLHNHIAEHREEIDMKKVLGAHDNLTIPINKGLTGMTKAIMKNPNTAPPLDLDYEIPFFLERDMQEAAQNIIKQLDKAGALDELPDIAKEKIITDLRMQFMSPRTRLNSFVKELKDLNILTDVNKNKLMPFLEENFKSKTIWVRGQKYYNPIIMRSRVQKELRTSPKLNFVQHEAQKPQEVTLEWALMNQDHPLMSPKDIYAFRFGDLFRKLESAYIFDTISKMTVDIGGMKPRILIKPEERAKARQALDKAAKEPEHTFKNNYELIPSDVSYDLKDWYVYKKFAPVIKDLIAKRKSVGTVNKMGYWLKRRVLYRFWYLARNNLVQQYVGSPGGFFRLKEAFTKMASRDIDYLTAERLNYFNQASYMVDKRLDDIIDDVQTLYSKSDIVNKLDKMFGGKGTFVKAMRLAVGKKSVVNRFYNTLHEVAWYLEKGTRFATWLQLRKNGMSDEDATARGQLIHGQYDRPAPTLMRGLGNLAYYANLRMNMLRFYKKAVTHPLKERKTLLRWLALKMLVGAAAYQYAWKPRKTWASRLTKATGWTKTILDWVFGYRYMKIIRDKEGKPTGETKVASFSLPPFGDVDKYLNRSLGTTIKLNAGPLPTLWWQLSRNRGIDGKKIVEMSPDELIKGLMAGIYGKRTFARFLGDSATYALGVYFPPSREIRDWINTTTDRNAIKVHEQLINSAGVAYIYAFTDSHKRIAIEMLREARWQNNKKVKMGEVKDKSIKQIIRMAGREKPKETGRWKELNIQMQRTGNLIAALWLVKNKKMDIEDAQELVFKAKKWLKQPSDRPKIAKLYGLDEKMIREIVARTRIE